jgi:flavin-binding protein dodecin
LAWEYAILVVEENYNGKAALTLVDIGSIAQQFVTRQTSVQSTLRNQRRTVMAQKVIEVVGTSKESFAKAAENAVAEAAKTVRNLKWARVAELEMELDGKSIAQYRTTAKIYFDIE